jgi:hypothetical protein
MNKQLLMFEMPRVGTRKLYFFNKENFETLNISVEMYWLAAFFKGLEHSLIQAKRKVT